MNRKLIRPNLGEIKEKMGRASKSHPPDLLPNNQTSNAVPSVSAPTANTVSQGIVGPRRRVAPPEQTNAESFYYLKQMQSKTPMVIVLQDGEKIKGVIEWYDKHCLKINCQKHPNTLLPKHSIKYMYKLEEEPRVRRTRTTKREEGTTDAHELDVPLNN